MATTNFTINDRVRSHVNDRLQNIGLLDEETCTNASPSATVLEATSANFFTGNVLVGSTVKNLTTNNTATVVSVDSATQVTTTSITNNYTGTDVFNVFNADNDENSFLSDEELEEVILGRINSQASSYSFQRLNTSSNYYKYLNSNQDEHFFLPTFTPEVSVDYEMHSNGYIKVTSGSPTATTISVTGNIVEMGELLFDVFMFLADHKCREINFTLFQNEIQNVEQTYAALVNQAHMVRGVYGV